jgi:hypothetical protein
LLFQQRARYLVTKLSNNFVQSVGLFCEVLGLSEEVLSCLQDALALRELVHGESHGRHVLGPLHDVVVLQFNIDVSEITYFWKSPIKPFVSEYLYHKIFLDQV